MLLRVLYLKNFRSYAAQRFDFSPGVNLISGPNARGKTTVLEAIYLLVSGHSFRTVQMSELIRRGEEFFSIEALYEKHGVEQRVSLTYGRDLLKVTHNSSSSATLMALFGTLSGVVMTPDDAALVKGNPQVRRRYLDLQIAQGDPLYIHYARRYQRAMLQRNALLKKRAFASIEGWEEEMASAAAYMSRQRAEALAHLSMSAAEKYRELSGEPQPLSMKYAPAIGAAFDRGDYLAQYKRSRMREAELGFTLKGPHKDDFVVAIGDKPVRNYGSEGEQRSCIAAMRFSEWERLQRALSIDPIMLVDDLGISLDSDRCGRICKALGELPSQVFLTTTQQEPLFPSTNAQKLITL